MSETVWIFQEGNRPAHGFVVPGLDHVSIHKSKEAALAEALVSVVSWEERAGAPQETVASHIHKWSWPTHTVLVLECVVGAGDGEK